MSVRIMVWSFLKLSSCPQQKDTIQRHLQARGETVQDFFLEYTLLNMVRKSELVQITLRAGIIYYCLPDKIPFGKEKTWFQADYAMGERSPLQVFRTHSVDNKQIPHPKVFRTYTT